MLHTWKIPISFKSKLNVALFHLKDFLKCKYNNKCDWKNLRLKYHLSADLPDYLILLYESALDFL